MVDLDGAALAFDLRGQQVIRDLGVREFDGDVAAAVAGEDGTAAVDGPVRELLRGGIQQRGHAGEAGGHAEDLDHGLDSVDADIHEGTRCHVAVEDIGGTPCENIVIARGVLAKAQRSAANGRNLAQRVLDGVEGGVVERTHGLEGHDASGLSGAEDLQRLRLGGAEGLLDDDVLAAGDAGKGLLVVKRVGAADIDGIDVVGGRELVECGEVSLAAVLGGKGGAALGIARERAHECSPVVGIDDLDKVVGDHGCADGRDAQHMSPLRCLVYRMSVARGSVKACENAVTGRSR